ncbi:MAG: hypothetical protein ACI4J7_09300 [Ruminiclostridium sp.]
MPRTSSLNIELNGSSEKDNLAEIYGAVIDNVSLTAVSSAIKNTDLSGDPATGSVEVKRFANAESQELGTARSKGKGDPAKVKPVTVNIDQHKEIIEEFKSFDIDKYGVPNLLLKRAASHSSSMVRELDRAFFATAVSAGTKFTPTKTKKIQILEEVVAAIEATKNDYVDGVDREDIVVTVSTTFHSAIRDELDELPGGMTYTNGIVGNLHGVAVYMSNRLPEGVDLVAMRYDSIAQPCVVTQYETEKIGLDNAHAVELFYDYGTKAVTEDLIKYVGDPVSSLSAEDNADESGS